MEYVFGTTKRRGVNYDCLKTKADKHTVLSGSVTVEMKYPDQIVTDKFVVLEKYRSEIDTEGNCYDWYIIDNHYRYIDKYTPNIPRVEGRIDDTENALCEATEFYDTSISDLENAICELTELIEGGN